MKKLLILIIVITLESCIHSPKTPIQNTSQEIGLDKDQFNNDTLVLPPPLKIVLTKNQLTFLSDKQLNTLLQWWNGIPTDTQRKVESQHLYIQVTGYYPLSKAKEYLKKQIQKDILLMEKILIGIIGKDTKGKGIADIRSSTKEVISNTPDRYVKILVIEK